MAERRMFHSSVVESDGFLDLPVSSQALYFHLGRPADDDGERPDRRRGRMQGGERVAAVCVQRSRADGKAHTGHRNRTALHARLRFGESRKPAACRATNGRPYEKIFTLCVRGVAL